MSLQFIIGQKTADKKQSYIEDIQIIMQKNPKAKVFIVVPEHAKFAGETTILEDLWKADDSNNPSFMGSIQLQVFSFSRLAWYFLKDEKIFHQKQLSDIGISMLLRKIVMDIKDELVLFRKEVDKEGFIQQLADLFRELRSGRITVEDLENAIQTDDSSYRFLDQQTKLKEIQMIYTIFCQQTSEGFVHYEMILEALANTISENQQEDVYFYVAGYYYFTSQEMQIIQAFLKTATKVTLVLDLDEGYPDAPPSMQNLFYQAGNTYYQFYQYARQNRIPVLRDKRIRTQTDGFSEGMVQLDKYWMETTSGKRNTAKSNYQNDDTIEVWSCDTKQAEIFHVANSINRLVAEKGYRYKDFLILARRVEDYETIVKPLFHKAKLDVFYDKAEAMSHHPFADFIDSLFRVHRNFWRYSDIMRLLRTELLIPATANTDLVTQQDYIIQYRDKVDQTENILLAQGYEGKAWFQKEEWQFYSFSEDETKQPHNGMREANEIKHFLQQTLVPFYKGLDRIKTGREAATYLFQFLEKNQVDKQLLFWRDAAIEENDLEKARQHEQIWKTFINLMDEYVETLGDTAFDRQTFYDILMTGFDSAEYSMVPPTLDEVVFSSMEGARFKPAKITYLMGATQENLPKVYENRSLLTEEDRFSLQAVIEEDGKFLRPSLPESTASEPYIAYQALLAGTDKLFITYPLSIDGNSRMSKLSPYIARIVKDFDITVQHRAANITNAHHYANFMGTKNQNIGQLVKLLREQLLSKEKMPLLWRKILTYLYHDESIQPTMNTVFASLKYKNTPAQLTSEIAEKLYGKDLYLSVSQLESYYLDSYSHFLQYGLRLRERQKYELSAAGTGEFYHEALENIVREMRGKGLLHAGEVEAIAANILKSLFGSDKYAILSSSNRMNFIKDQLNETIQRISWVVNGQKNRTAFENIRTEAVFGYPGVPDALEGIVFPLKDNRQLHIRGKIDRIDRVEKEGKQFLSVLDYKSSQHTFQFLDAYYGLAMQMITYLDVALLNAKGTMDPAGAFYLHVKNPYIEVLGQPDEGEWEKQVMSDYKLKGLLIADRQVTDAMDPHVEDGESSLVLPFRYTKKGEFAKSNNDLVTPDELNLLILNNRRRIQEAGNHILSGDLKLNPIKDRPFIPSVQGPYRMVSQFDSTLPENRYRRLEKLDKKAVLERLRLELDERGEDDDDDTTENS